MPPPPPALRKAELPQKLPEPPKVAPKSILKNPLKAPPASAVGDPGKMISPSEISKHPSSGSEGQPEAKRARIAEDAAKAEDASKAEEAARGENGLALPEGFFDDPKLDAKARDIEYKDPQEVEWEMFVKELREEGSKSEQVSVSSASNTPISFSIIPVVEDGIKYNVTLLLFFHR